MKKEFPKLPHYEYSWRSIQVEPIPLSGERITLGIIIKGSDQALMVTKIIPSAKINKIYGSEFGQRISEAMGLCVKSAEQFYKNKPVANMWNPPLEGFYVSDVRSSLSEDIEEGLLRAAMYCSSFSVAVEKSKSGQKSSSSMSVPETWRKDIQEAIRIERSDILHCFEKKVKISGANIPIKFGFISSNTGYAAQFDVFGETGTHQSLVRAQSKLWQLDRLRDNNVGLFQTEVCELVIKTPARDQELSTNDALNGFIEELRYEASRRDIGIYTADTPADAAKHIIENAA